MKRLLYAILWYVTLLSAMEGQAQDFFILSGHITDLQGKPLPFATIKIDDTTLGTYADSIGYYSLHIPKGKYSLTVSLVGYLPSTKSFIANKNCNLNFILEKDTINLQEANVYGKGSIKRTRESVFATNAIDVKSVANFTTKLSDLVNRTTGIRIRTEGGLGADYDLSLNGMSGNSIRYFIDNIPLDVKGNEISLANLPVNTIDRIEIYKGVVPSYLGADALGGAINIVTRKEKSNFLDVSYSIGSFHTHIADLNALIVMPQSKIIIKPTFGISSSKNDYTMKGVELWNEEVRKYLPTNVKRFHDDYLSIFSQLEFGIENKKWADAFYLSGSYSKVNKELQTGAIQTIVYGMAEKEQEAWNMSARYNKRNLFTDGLQANVLVSHTWEHSVTIDTTYRKYQWDGNYIESSRNEITGRAKQLRHYKRPLTITRINLDYQLNEQHAFNVNYMLHRNGNRRYDKIDNDFSPSKDLLSKHIIGISYSQLLFQEKMANNFFIKNYINHAKIEQTDLSWITHSDKIPNKTTENNLGYGIGTRYIFFEPFALKLSYEHAIRLPMAKELLGNGNTIYPNLALKPESSDNYNAGLFGYIHSDKQHSISYEANAFFRKVKDYIHTVLSQSDGTIQYENVSDVNIKGLEGEIRYLYNNRLQCMINCSYQDSRNMNKFKQDGKPSIIYKNKIPNTPWLYGNGEITFTQPDFFCKTDKLRLSYLYQYIHWFYLTWEGYGSLETNTRIPTQHFHSAVISYSLKNDRYNIALECNNLFDSKLYDNYMLQKPGRSFTCKFRLFIH